MDMARGGKRPGAGRTRQFDDPKRMAIVLSRELYGALCAEAEAQGTKPSTLARELIQAGLAATKPPRSPRGRRGRS